MKPASWKLWIAGLAILSMVIFGWRYFASDPREVFLEQIDVMLEKANEGEHTDLRGKVSPEADRYITSYFMPVPQALLLTRKIDKEERCKYRLLQVHVFNAGDYAEVEVERSGPNGMSRGARAFPLPFVYRHGEWLLAGEFRGDRVFINPYR